MAVGGPNTRNDYHSKCFFLQLQKHFHMVHVAKTDAETDTGSFGVQSMRQRYEFLYY